MVLTLEVLLEILDKSMNLGGLASRFTRETKIAR